MKKTLIWKAEEGNRRCMGCGGCIAVCLQEALSFNETNQIIIDQSKCIGCRQCVMVCPEMMLKLEVTKI